LLLLLQPATKYQTRHNHNTHKKIDSMKQGDAFKWVLVAAGAFALYKIMQKVGFIQTKEEKEAEQKLTAAVTGWQFDPLKKIPKEYKYRMGIAGTGEDQYAKKIWDAIGGWLPDDEEKIYGVFRSLRYQSMAQDIAEAFQRLYKQDLVTKLRSVLSDAEMLTILQILESKPKGWSKDNKTYI